MKLVGTTKGRGTACQKLTAWLGPYPPRTPFWTGRTLHIAESDGDSGRFAMTDGNRLNMVSAAADWTTNVVTIAATVGSVFADVCSVKAC